MGIPQIDIGVESSNLSAAHAMAGILAFRLGKTGLHLAYRNSAGMVLAIRRISKNARTGDIKIYLTGGKFSHDT